MTDRETIERLEAENTALALDAIRANTKCNAAWSVVAAARMFVKSVATEDEEDNFRSLEGELAKLDEVTK